MDRRDFNRLAAASLGGIVAGASISRAADKDDKAAKDKDEPKAKDPKKPALLKFNAAVKRGVDPQTIIAAAKAFAAYDIIVLGDGVEFPSMVKSRHPVGVGAVEYGRSKRITRPATTRRTSRG